jgi:hypothetical protein
MFIHKSVDIHESLENENVESGLRREIGLGAGTFGDILSPLPSGMHVKHQTRFTLEPFSS